jgi:hypothetical protein
MFASGSAPPSELLKSSLKGGPFISGTTFMSLTLGQRPIPMLPPPSKKRRLEDEEPGETKVTRSKGDSGLTPGLKSGKRSGGPIAPVSLRTLVEKGFLQAGRDNLSVNYKGTTFTASLEKDGTIRFEGETFNSASAFSVHAKRKLTPHKQGDDGWKSVYYAGKQLDAFRQQYNEQYANLAPGGALPPRPPGGGAAAGAGAAGMPRAASGLSLAADSPAGSGGGPRPSASQQLQPTLASQRAPRTIKSAFFGSESETEEDEDEEFSSSDEEEDDGGALLRVGGRGACCVGHVALGCAPALRAPALRAQGGAGPRGCPEGLGGGARWGVQRPALTAGARPPRPAPPRPPAAQVARPPVPRLPTAAAAPLHHQQAPRPAAPKPKPAAAKAKAGSPSLAKSAKKASGGGAKSAKAGGGAQALRQQEVLVSPQLLAQAAAANVALETDQWVQCSRCEEWRTVPNAAWPGIQASDDDWFCEQASWDVTRLQPFSKACRPGAKAGAKR